MFSRFMKTLLGASLAVSAIGFSGAASAETRDLSYIVPWIGIEMNYRGMGYADDEGNFIDLAGSHIISAHVQVDFAPGAGADISSFFMAMVVPVLGTDNQYFTVDGSQLVESSPGHYTYSLTTTEFNGEIYSGRFSVEAYGMDADGNAIWLPGTATNTGFFYTVDVANPVPEPSTLLMMAGGLALVPVMARRRRAKQEA